MDRSRPHQPGTRAPAVRPSNETRGQSRRPRRRPELAVRAGLLALIVAVPAAGQTRRGTPIPPLRDSPVGHVAARGVLLDPNRRGFQTVAVSVNGGGAVEVFGDPAVPVPVPAYEGGDTLVRLCTGRTYRMRVSDVPGLPAGVTLFPSVELVDRLHPPTGLESAFPLPISVTEREAELAAGGVLVTKVIYLEDPLIAPVTQYDGPLRRTDLPPNADPLADADARGRVIAVVRLGGRTPDPRFPEPAFYGTGGPVFQAPPADPNLPLLPPVTDPTGVRPIDYAAPQLPGCPPGGGCPGTGCPECPPADAVIGGCPTGGCPTGAAAGAPAVPVVPYYRGFVLDATLPAPFCPADVRPRDEYLCDGGDRLRPVGTTYDGIALGGLDTEDAVVRFRGSGGEVEVRPTNRVCIYAPRFAEVRTFFGVINDTRYRETAGLTKTAAVTAAAIDVPTGTLRQDVRPDSARVRSRVSGLIAENPWSGLSDVLLRQENVRIVESLKVFVGDRANLRTGVSAAQLAERADAAATWTRADNPVIFYRGEGAAVAIEALAPQVIVGLEDHGKPGTLCVRKLADRVFAAPGDTVTFTIELENVGEKPLTDLVVLDNLTPRLEYVEGTAESTLPGRVEVTPNGEGSAIVRFVLSDPLPGGAGGAVTFQTRVR